LNVCNDLAEAMKALDGKKIDPVIQDQGYARQRGKTGPRACHGTGCSCFPGKVGASRFVQSDSNRSRCSGACLRALLRWLFTRLFRVLPEESQSVADSFSTRLGLWHPKGT
jgi:hypothetical protein